MEWLLLLLIIILLFIFYRKFKKITLGNLVLVTGALKSGKSGLSVYLALRIYRKNVIQWYISNWFIRLCKRLHIKKFKDINEYPYKPMLYSNIKLLNVKHNPLTLDILLRKVRIPNKSVVLIDEIALLADSQCYKDLEINAILTYFVKLFAHYSHCGTLIINTQNISDCHYAFKRCVNSYYYIHHKSRYPFFSLFHMQELYYSEDGSLSNVNITGDIADNLKLLLISNKYFKKYDICCYSILTDNLEYEVDYEREIITTRSDLKSDNIISLNRFAHLLKGGDKNEIRE